MSKLIIALVALSCLFVLAAAQNKQHCFDKSFQTQLRVFEPKKDFVDTQTLFVDADAGLVRIDMNIKEPSPRNVSVYVNYQTQMRYTLDVASGQCQSEPMSQPQQPFCISSNATFVRYVLFFQYGLHDTLLA